ncbi:hypothetical protein IF1G_07755 [Cordyceps javanica]|uniref:Uncharacterized protein n=1 Tax=Cordyceps javanica TaxID=43265 RepID=A0A545UUN4_9HYPO|nr:hypothetical protein IF1G_07755 [Cordyceps javanica]
MRNRRARSPSGVYRTRNAYVAFMQAHSGVDFTYIQCRSLKRAASWERESWGGKGISKN